MEGNALKVWEERRDIITPVNGRVDGLGEHLVAARATGVHEDKVTSRHGCVILFQPCSAVMVQA